MIRDQIKSLDELWLQPWVKYWRKKEKEWFLLKPQMKAIVNPISKAKSQEKVRGRKCVVLWIAGSTDKVAVLFLLHPHIDTGLLGLETGFLFFPVY